MTLMRTILTSILVIFFAITAVAHADADGPDYKTWQKVAERAETTIDSDRASIEAMDGLRAEISVYRQEFSAAQNANRSRINTLHSQLTGLGPEPEGGDDDVVAARRAELWAQLSLAQQPVIAAEDAYILADALIQEIDRLIRERLREEFTFRGPTPLKLSDWPEAYRHLGRALHSIPQETVAAWNNPSNRVVLHRNLPLILLASVLAFVLIWRGRAWSEWAVEKLRKYGGRGTGVWDFIASLGGILLPLVGLSALSIAIISTSMFGLRGTALINQLAGWGLVFLWFRWLSERVFSRREGEVLLNLPLHLRAEARWYSLLLALLIVINNFLELVVDYGNFSALFSAILFFPLTLFAGIILFRMGQILRNSVKDPDGAAAADRADGAEGDPKRTSERVARVLGLVMMLIGIAAPVMAALGYDAASKGLVFPMVLSIALLAFVLILQRLFGDIYGWITGKGKDGREALIPVLIGFVLVLASGPILALFWGARTADLYEWWRSFLAGYTVGGVGISPAGFLTFVAIFSVGYMVTRLIQGMLRSNVLPKTRIDIGGQNAIVSGLGYVGIFLAALIAISSAGIDLSNIAIIAGALSVGIGFGLQTIVSNFVSGIILLIERPISEGDWIEVNGQMGYVRDISVRATRIETFDRTDVIVPNSDLISGTVTNFTRGNTIGRVIIKVGVAYGTDTKRVENILREIASDHPMVLANPAPIIVFQEFGADALEFEIRAIMRDVNWILTVRTDLNHEVAKRFGEEGIEIPFAQRDIWLRNPEVLKGTGV